MAAGNNAKKRSREAEGAMYVLHSLVAFQSHAFRSRFEKGARRHLPALGWMEATASFPTAFAGCKDVGQPSARSRSNTSALDANKRGSSMTFF